MTLAEFADRYLTRYATIRKPVSVDTLRARLVRPLAEFGDTQLDELRTGDIAAWEATLPPRFRYAVMRALRQLLDAAVSWEYLPRNPAKTGAAGNREDDARTGTGRRARRRARLAL